MKYKSKWRRAEGRKRYRKTYKKATRVYRRPAKKWSPRRRVVKSRSWRR